MGSPKKVPQTRDRGGTPFLLGGYYKRGGVQAIWTGGYSPKQGPRRFFGLAPLPAALQRALAAERARAEALAAGNRASLKATPMNPRGRPPIVLLASVVGRDILRMDTT